MILIVRHTSSKFVQSMKLAEYPYQSKMDERKLTFLQINFCGLSEHSKIALNHYVHEKNPDVVFLNETKANLLRHFLNNYNAISEHKHGLGGVAILLKEEIPYARLSELEENSVDNIVITIVSNGLKLVVSTAYVQPENLDGVKNIMKVLENCKKLVDDNKINSCIFFGDLNARHQYWGDTMSNRLGEETVKIVDTYSILNNGEPTFISTNGSSVIDLCLIYGPIVSHYEHNLATDEYVELFTGAPNRGHLPVLVDFAVSTEKLKTKKLWMEKANWKLWKDYVETGIGEIDLNDNNSTTQWKTFLNLLLDASEKYIPLKTISRHSKPFWNSELTKSSEELRHLRRKFKYCSNYINGEKLARAKENFKKQLSDSASIWMNCFLSNLGHKRGRDFWASYKSLLNKKKEEVGLIRNKTGELLYTKSEICTQFETTFFSGQHLSEQSYDEVFFEHVEQEVRVPDSSDEHENGLFVDPLNMEELNAAIANTSNTRSFDTDDIHLSMIKNLGYKARELLLQIFNNCWETASWPWKESRVIFIRKPNKERYDDCSSYRPLSISSHFGKLLERILAGRINKYLDLHNIIGQEQEGFRTKRNTVRSLYRLHLSLE